MTTMISRHASRDRSAGDGSWATCDRGTSVIGVSIGQGGVTMNVQFDSGFYFETTKRNPSISLVSGNRRARAHACRGWKGCQRPEDGGGRITPTRFHAGVERADTNPRACERGGAWGGCTGPQSRSITSVLGDEGREFGGVKTSSCASNAIELKWCEGRQRRALTCGAVGAGRAGGGDLLLGRSQRREKGGTGQT